MFEFYDDGISYEYDGNIPEPEGINVESIKPDIYSISRTKRQHESADIWKNSKGKGTLNLIMRFGKTKVAKIIYDKCKEKNKDLKTIIIIPNSITRNNILTEFEKNDNTKILSIFEFVNEYNNKVKFSCDLLILDEVHRFLSDSYISKINSINCKFKLGLTGAKLSKDDIKYLKDLEIPIIDSISEIEAISNGWISPYIEYNLPVELRDNDKNSYAEYSKRISDTVHLFNGMHISVNKVLKADIFDTPFSLALSCFTGKSYYNYPFIKPDVLRNIVASCAGWKKDMIIQNDYDRKINQYWNPDNLYERCKLFKEYIKNRNEILINNRNKIDKVIEVIKYNDVPTICFNESTKMVDVLVEYFHIDGIGYHSNIESRFVWDKTLNDIIRTKDGRPKKIGKTGLKNLAIKGMKDGTYKYLFTAKALNEGLTIENIEQVITTGGSTNPTTHDQRIARGKTLDYSNPNKCCIIVNLYIDDFYINDILVKSRDKQKLILRQSKSEIEPIWINSIEEIEKS